MNHTPHQSDERLYKVETYDVRYIGLTLSPQKYNQLVVTVRATNADDAQEKAEDLTGRAWSRIVKVENDK